MQEHLLLPSHSRDRTDKTELSIFLLSEISDTTQYPPRSAELDSLAGVISNVLGPYSSYSRLGVNYLPNVLSSRRKRRSDRVLPCLFAPGKLQGSPASHVQLSSEISAGSHVVTWSPLPHRQHFPPGSYRKVWTHKVRQERLI
jgi:hypothetical protein